MMFERWIVLPIRWFINHVRDVRALSQKCKVCGQSDGFSFDVPDEIWDAVVPKQFQGRVVCLRCFDRFAAQRGVSYRNVLRLWFAGEKHSFELEVK